MAKEGEEGEKVGMSAAQYCTLFSQIRDSVGDRDVALVIFQEMAKDMRSNQIRQEKQRNGDAATTRQKRYLRRLGVEFRPEISFEEASRLIDEALEREA